jgi:hypothetical protein
MTTSNCPTLPKHPALNCGIVLGLLFVCHPSIAGSLAGSNALQRAVSQWRPGETISLPAGTFTITEPVKLRSGMRLIGAGWRCYAISLNCASKSVGVVALEKFIYNGKQT